MAGEDSRSLLVARSSEGDWDEDTEWEGSKEREGRKEGGEGGVSEALGHTQHQ
jgi:hypothetical protein